MDTNRRILKKGTKFIILGKTENKKEEALKDVNVTIHCRNMGKVYFVLGKMMCKTDNNLLP